MKLFFDTSDNQKTVIKLGQKESTIPTTSNKSQQLLPLLEKILKESNKSLADITEIEFNTGPGSYTGLKVGASIANTLGFVLRIPVNGKDVSEEGPIEPKYE